MNTDEFELALNLSNTLGSSIEELLSEYFEQNPIKPPDEKIPHIKLESSIQGI